MKKLFFPILICVVSSIAANAQDEYTVNYDESKVAPYTIPDPLTFSNGRKVRNSADWKLRRAEILEIFQEEMYGRMPAPSPIYCQKFEEGTTAAGFGIRKQVRMFFREDHTGPYVDWLIVTPKYGQGPFKTVLMLNYFGNHTILKDKEVLVTDGWLRNMDLFSITEHHTVEESRGAYETKRVETSAYPVDMLISRGYALVTACYGEISPDPVKNDFGHERQDAFAKSRGVFDLWPEMPRSKGNSTTALMAWAWTLCRARGFNAVRPEPVHLLRGAESTFRPRLREALVRLQGRVVVSAVGRCRLEETAPRGSAEECRISG